MILVRNLVFVLSVTLCWWSGIFSSSAFPWFLKDYPTAPVNERPHFDLNSEVLYLNRIDYAVLHQRLPEGMFGFRIIGDPRTLDVANLSVFKPLWQPDISAIKAIYPYQSQTTIVADFYAWLGHHIHLPRETMLSVMRFMMALAAVLAIAPIFHLISKIWGHPAGIALWLWLCTATGFNLFSVSLYWSIYLSIVPTSIAAIVALRITSNRCGWRTLCISNLTIFVACVIKFLAGFEFASVIAFAPLAVFAIIAFQSKTIYKHSLIAAILSVSAVVCGLIAAMLLYNHFYHEAFGSSGLDHLFSRVSHWQQQNINRNPMRLLVPLWFGVGHWGVPNVAAFFLVMLAIGATPFVLAQQHNYNSKIKGAITATALAGLASLSWIILQYNHIAFHPRYVTFLVSFPLSIFAVPAMMVLLQSKLRG